MSLCCFLLSLSVLSPVAQAAVVAGAPPANAHTKPYASGWECGFQKIGESCQVIRVPAHGYLAANTYGTGWECDRGFRAKDSTCEPVKVPENGYFVENSAGLGWTCERGYKKLGASCKAIDLPKNAHLDYSGNDWECDRPYTRRQDQCAVQ